MNLPPLAALDAARDTAHGVPDDADAIVRALGSHGIEVEEVGADIGPQAVRYRLTLAAGILPAKVERAIDAVALATGRSVRYGGVVGSAVAVEVERPERSGVQLAPMIEAGHALIRLGFIAGRTFDDVPLQGRLADLPHLLVAGTTGGGKSTFVVQLLTTLLLRNTPGDLRLMLIDPKRVELSAFAGVPHLLEPIVTDAQDAVRALRRVVAMMDARYRAFEASGTKNLEEHNAKAPDGARLPRVVVVVDELADLMMTSPKMVEDHVVRLGQLARAAGIHLVLATQRPDAKTITPKIKANMPGRAVFRVNSHVDSKVALDYTGAERLLGSGDGLFLAPGMREPARFQSPAASADEVDRVVTWWKQNAPTAAPASPEVGTATLASIEDDAEEVRASLDRIRAEIPVQVISTWQTPPGDILAEAGFSDEVVDALAELVAERLLERLAPLLEGMK